MAARARAGRGTGHVVQRSPGRWWVRRSHTADGVRHQWWEGPHPSKREAEAAKPRIGNPDRLTDAGDWIRQWSATEVQELKRTGRYSDAILVERHVRVHLGNLLDGHKIGEIRTATVNGWLRSLARKQVIVRGGAALGAAGGSPILGDHTLSRKYVSNLRGTLSRAMQAAVDADLLNANPCRDATTPGDAEGRSAAPSRTRRNEPKTDDEDDSGGLLGSGYRQSLTEAVTARIASWCVTHLDDEDWALPTLIALHCGLRRGEVLALHHRSFTNNFESLQVDRQVLRHGRTVSLVTPKSQRSVRTVPTSEAVADAVRARVENGDLSTMGELFWRTTKVPGTRRREEQLRDPEAWTQWTRRWFRIKLDTEIPAGTVDAELPAGFTIHWLRHTFATRLIYTVGVPIATVSALLGHSTIDVTDRVYAHPTQPDERTADAVRRAARIAGT